LTAFGERARMLGAGGRVAARFEPWFEPATTTPEVLASVLSTISWPRRHRPENSLLVDAGSVTLAG
jgi:hypothetical protein